MISDKKQQQEKVAILEKENFDQLVDIDIWSEPEDTSTGTVNSLVRRITTEYDPTFMKTVIYTHHSFTTSLALFHKLKTRFSVPPSVETQKAQAIQLRVGVVLKFWIQVRIFSPGLGELSSVYSHGGKTNRINLLTLTKNFKTKCLIFVMC